MSQHHHHGHDHHHHHHHGAAGKLRTAFFLNLIFTLAEIAGGIWTGSAAILADALHDLGDSISLGLAWFLQNYSRKESDKKYSYGYRRFSMLGALVNGMVILGGSIFMLSQVIPRLIEPQMPEARGMILFAVVGVLVNGAAVFQLKGGNSLNERVARLHLLEDVLGWIAVLIVSIVLLIWEIPILDPILSVIITVYILYKTFANLRRTLALFLQSVPEEMDLEELERKVMSIDNVRSVHHLHFWSLDGEEHVLTAHIVVHGEASREQIVQVKENLRKAANIPGLKHITIEVELEGEECGIKD